PPEQLHVVIARTRDIRQAKDWCTGRARHVTTSVQAHGLRQGKAREPTRLVARLILSLNRVAVFEPGLDPFVDERRSISAEDHRRPSATGGPPAPGSAAHGRDIVRARRFPAD